jgi:hypothetical protein
LFAAVAGVAKKEFRPRKATEKETNSQKLRIMWRGMGIIGLLFNNSSHEMESLFRQRLVCVVAATVHQKRTTVKKGRRLWKRNVYEKPQVRPE